MTRSGSQTDANKTAARYERAREQLAGLSAREHEVALAVGRDLANAEIATELHMSAPTQPARLPRSTIGS